MNRTECQTVVSYLETFGKKGLTAEESERVGDHVKTCRGCFERVADYFRLLKSNGPGYVDESIDDLTLAIYNLVKALLKKTPAKRDEEKHDNLRFYNEPGDASEYVKEGAEAIDDVEDFLGTDEVRGESMESIRALLETSCRELAEKLLQKGADLGGRYSLDCRNLQGVLAVYSKNWDEAERAFAAVISAPAVEPYVRNVQSHAMINLAYVHQARKGYDDAVKWGRRAKSLAEELGLDTFCHRFGLAYFHLLRDGRGDLESANSEIDEMLADEKSARELRFFLALDQNKVIRELYSARGLLRRIEGSAA